MTKLRLRYSKNGKARYISHLDLIATMIRALLRAGVELKYTEGFNPHPYMSVALPLSVGCGSICELMDISVVATTIPDGFAKSVNDVLPEGIEVLDVYSPERKFNEIAWIGINGVLQYDTGSQSNVAERLASRFDEESIIIQKRTKRGVSDIDIAPFIRDISFHCGSDISMSACICAQNPTINPENLISALEGGSSALLPDFASFTRRELYSADMTEFR